MSHPMSGRASSLAAALQRAPPGGGNQADVVLVRVPPPGSAVRCISCAMRLRPLQRPPSPWWQRRYAPSLRSLNAKVRRKPSPGSADSSSSSFPSWSTSSPSTARLSGLVHKCPGAAQPRVGRCEMIGIFPNRSTLLRFVGTILEGQNDEWAVGDATSVRSQCISYSNPVRR